jgi:hypothetical protein
VLHHVVIDPGFSIDLTPLVGAAFLRADTFAVLSSNKSYVLLRTDAKANAPAEWRHFLETSGSVAEVRRSRFATVRARQMYVLSLAYDAGADELITVSVPNPRHKQLVVSRFDGADLQLSSEFMPTPGPGVRLAPKRDLADYVVIGAAVSGDRLYAISAAYSTLLVVDLNSKTLVAAYAVTGIARPVGLAIRDSKLCIAQADGRLAVVERP